MGWASVAVPSGCGFLYVSPQGGQTMETRIALLAILVENEESVEALNDILHQCSCTVK